MKSMVGARFESVGIGGFAMMTLVLGRRRGRVRLSVVKATIQLQSLVQVTPIYKRLTKRWLVWRILLASNCHLRSLLRDKAENSYRSMTLT